MRTDGGRWRRRRSRRPRRDRQGVRPPLHAGEAALLLDQGQERAGGLRGDPPGPTLPHPGPVRAHLDADQFRLYDGWKRAIASQMNPAEIERTTVEIDAVNGARRAELRAVGRVRFDGFIAAYTDQKEDDAEDEESKRLPEIREGEGLQREAVVATQHRPSAAALHRGDPHQEDGGTRHRPSVDLRRDAEDAGGPRIRGHRQAPAYPPFARPPVTPSSRTSSTNMSNTISRPTRGEAGRDLRRQARLERSAARLLEGLFRPCRGDARAARVRTCSTRSTRSWRRWCSRAGRRPDPPAFARAAARESCR